MSGSRKHALNPGERSNPEYPKLNTTNIYKHKTTNNIYENKIDSRKTDYSLIRVAREWRESGGYAALTLHHRYTRMGKHFMEYDKG